MLPQSPGRNCLHVEAESPSSRCGHRLPPSGGTLPATHALPRARGRRPKEGAGAQRERTPAARPCPFTHESPDQGQANAQSGRRVQSPARQRKGATPGDRADPAPPGATSSCPRPLPPPGRTGPAATTRRTRTTPRTTTSRPGPTEPRTRHTGTEQAPRPRTTGLNHTKPNRTKPGRYAWAGPDRQATAPRAVTGIPDPRPSGPRRASSRADPDSRRRLGRPAPALTRRAGAVPCPAPGAPLSTGRAPPRSSAPTPPPRRRPRPDGGARCACGRGRVGPTQDGRVRATATGGPTQPPHRSTGPVPGRTP